MRWWYFGEENTDKIEFTWKCLSCLAVGNNNRILAQIFKLLKPPNLDSNSLSPQVFWKQSKIFISHWAHQQKKSILVLAALPLETKTVSCQSPCSFLTLSHEDKTTFCFCVLEHDTVPPNSEVCFSLPVPGLCEEKTSWKRIPLKGPIKHCITLHYCISFKPQINCPYLRLTTHLSSTPYLSPTPTAASASYRKAAICLEEEHFFFFLTLAHTETPDKHTLFQYVNKIHYCSPTASQQETRWD